MIPYFLGVATRLRPSISRRIARAPMDACRARLRARAATGWLSAAILCAWPNPAQAEPETQSPTAQDATTTVTVTGTRPALVHGARDATAASTVILKTQLERPGATSADILALVPGVTVLRTGSAAEFATASIRGTESRQIPVYFAGIRLNDEVGGAADLSTIPLWMVQRVEIYRGNSPNEADRSGLAGAIFFEPLRPAAPALGANVSLGSFGERGVWGSAATGGPKASTLVGLRHSRAENNYSYVNDHGRRFDLDETRERRHNADYKEQDAWAVGDYVLSQDVHLTMLVNALDREQGATSISTTPAERARTQLRRLLGGLVATVRCGAQCRLALSHTSLVTSAGTTDPALELRTASGTWLHHRAERHTQSARLTLTPWEFLTLNSSLEHAHEGLRLSHPKEAQRNSSREELGLTLNAVVAPEQALSPQFVVRSRCAWTHGSYVRLSQREERRDVHCNAQPPDLRAGLRYRLTDTTRLLLNVSHATQAPVLGELYGISPTVYGNPILLPEVSDNLDVGIETRFKLADVQLDLDAFVFGRWAKHLIRYKQTSLNALAPDNELSTTRVLGAEGALTAQLFKHWVTRTSLTALDPRRITALGNKNPILPMLSRLTWSQELTGTYALPTLNVSAASLSLRYWRASSRYYDDSGFVVLPRQQYLDGDLSVALKRPALRVRASVENILNGRSQDLLGLPLPGTSFHASLEAWFR